MYKYDQKPNTTLSVNARTLLDDIRKSKYVVLCGRNNCGKSYFLKLIKQTVGETASLLGPARYQNFNMLAPYAPRDSKRSEEHRQWWDQWQNSTQNLDNSPFNLQQAIAELSNIKREQLIEIMDMLLGARMEILHTIPENSMSQLTSFDTSIHLA